MMHVERFEVAHLARLHIGHPARCALFPHLTQREMRQTPRAAANQAA